MESLCVSTASYIIKRDQRMIAVTSGGRIDSKQIQSHTEKGHAPTERGDERWRRI